MKGRQLECCPPMQRMLCPQVKPFGEGIRKPGVGDGFGSCGEVVLDALNFRGVECGVNKAERSSGIAVARLADTSRVDQMTTFAPKRVPLPVLGNDVRDVGMSNAAGSRREPFEHPPHIGPFQDMIPVVRIERRCVDECDVIHNLQSRESFEKFHGSLAEMSTRPFNRYLSFFIERSQRKFAGYAHVVVSAYDEIAEFIDILNAFLGVGSIAHDIPEADDAVCLLAVRGFDHAIERLEVPMDVRDDGYTHCGVMIVKKHSHSGWENQTTHLTPFPSPLRRGE